MAIPSMAATVQAEGVLDRVLRILRLNVGLSLSDIEALVKRLGPNVVETSSPYYVSIDGYDEDPRELWQIPEVRELAERAIAAGLISILEVNLHDRHPCLFGAFDLYALANNLILNTPPTLAHAGCSLVSDTEVSRFSEVLMASNVRAEALMWPRES